MKRFMPVVVVSMSLGFSPMQAGFFPQHRSSVVVFPTVSTDLTSATPARNDDGTALAVLAGIGAFAGVCYLVSCLPSFRLDSAQTTYNNFDSGLAEIIAYADQYALDFEALTARLYPCSAYPLVKLFNVLCQERKEAMKAVESLDAALWWSHEATFVRTCKQLQKLLNVRIGLLEKSMASLREQSSWMSQYSLYLQECNNERLESLEYAVWAQSMNNHSCHTTTVIVPVQVP